MAEGFIELGLLDKARFELHEIDPFPEDLVRFNRLRVRIHLDYAQLAIAKGEYARARNQLDRAQGIAPESSSLKRMYATLLMHENLASVWALAGLLIALVLTMVVRLKHRMSRKRFVRIQSKIDQFSQSSTND